MRLLKTKKKTQNCKELKKYARDLNGGGGIFIDRHRVQLRFLLGKKSFCLLLFQFSNITWICICIFFFSFSITSCVIGDIRRNPLLFFNILCNTNTLLCYFFFPQKIKKICANSEVRVNFIIMILSII